MFVILFYLINYLNVLLYYHFYTFIMLSTTAFTISSRLSSVPETEALDRIKAELDSAHTDQSNSDIDRRSAKKRRNNQGIDFIEVLTENKRQNTWY
jgi:phage terminase Nu1 subunit (DNA packaging protein)